jgi:hypothetical protein
MELTVVALASAWFSTNGQTRRTRNFARTSRSGSNGLEQWGPREITMRLIPFFCDHCFVDDRRFPSASRGSYINQVRSRCRSIVRRWKSQGVTHAIVCLLEIDGPHRMLRTPSPRAFTARLRRPSRPGAQVAPRALRETAHARVSLVALGSREPLLGVARSRHVRIPDEDLAAAPRVARPKHEPIARSSSPRLDLGGRPLPPFPMGSPFLQNAR